MWPPFRLALAIGFLHAANCSEQAGLIEHDEVNLVQIVQTVKHHSARFTPVHSDSSLSKLNGVLDEPIQALSGAVTKMDVRAMVSSDSSTAHGDSRAAVDMGAQTGLFSDQQAYLTLKSADEDAYKGRLAAETAVYTNAKAAEQKAFATQAASQKAYYDKKNADMVAYFGGKADAAANYVAKKLEKTNAYVANKAAMTKAYVDNKNSFATAVVDKKAAAATQYQAAQQTAFAKAVAAKQAAVLGS